MARETFDAGSFAFPKRCVVCDSEDVEMVEYTQEHFPIAVPGYGGIYRTTSAALPYCKYHADAFHFRFRVLQITQYFVIAIMFLCGFTGGVLEANAQQANDQLVSILLVVAMTCFFVILPASLIVRHLMYDAFFRLGGDTIQVKSKHEQFIARLRQVNGMTAQPEVQQDACFGPPTASRSHD